MKSIVLAKDIYLIKDFLSPEKCNEFIRSSENIGFGAATIETDNGPRVVDHIRNNSRVLYKDLNLAEELWMTLEPEAPKSIGESRAIGLNELFRFYKYHPGQQFRKHRDQSFVRNNLEASYYTFMIYLNDNFRGGETRFNNCVVAPEAGAALIFYHQLEHEGSEVLEGVKYVLRTDIMYRLNKF